MVSCFRHLAPSAGAPQHSCRSALAQGMCTHVVWVPCQHTAVSIQGPSMAQHSFLTPTETCGACLWSSQVDQFELVVESPAAAADKQARSRLPPSHASAAGQCDTCQHAHPDVTVPDLCPESGCTCSDPACASMRLDTTGMRVLVRPNSHAHTLCVC
jgi:hypothetical protein